jgi:hypothetical protein
MLLSRLQGSDKVEAEILNFSADIFPLQTGE